MLRAVHPFAFRWLIFLALATSGTATAQEVAQRSAQADPFSYVHLALSDAAGRALVAALADKPWMKASNGTGTDDGSSRIAPQNAVERLRTAVARVEHLRPVLEPILRAEGVPPELSAVVLVESGGLTTALSRKGARGVWQFMPGTARRYGLVVDRTHDDRVDVVKSTHAAGRYLSDLHARFGDWSVALAAYNAGELAVDKAINRAASRNFGSISDSGFLPAETRNYVPAIVAAMSRLRYSNFLGLEVRENNGADVVYALSVSGG